jgi:hypothetical protein
LKRAGQAETHQYYRHVGAFGGGQVDLAVTDHQGAGGIASGKSDRLGEVARIGLRHGKCVAAGDCPEIAAEAKRPEQSTGEIFALVGADREPRARRLEGFERGYGAGVGAALLGDIGLVMDQKLAEHGVDVVVGTSVL